MTLCKEEEGKTHPFHCTACGNTTNIVGGTVTSISPILEPSGQITVITTCKSCKAKWAFQDSDQPATVVEVWLNRKPETQSFYCSLGGGETKEGNRILDYSLRQVYSYIDHTYVHLPFTSRCTNFTCPVVYRFT